MKDVLNFYTLNDNSKKAVLEQSQKLRRGAAGVAHGKPATLFDASMYIKQAWEEVNKTSIQNCFQKADLKIQFVGDLGQCTNKNMDLNVDDLVDLFKEMTVTIDKHTLEEFVRIDNEQSAEYVEAITTEIQQALEELNSNSEGEEGTEDVEETVVERETEFRGYSKLYAEAVETESQLSSEAALGLVK